MLKNLLQVRKPHVLFVGEANLWKDAERNKCSIEGYNLVTSSMIDNVNSNVSRIVAYVKHGIRFNKIRNLEDKNFSSIWMEVGLPYCKKFILGGVCREHQHFKVSQEDYDTDSSTSEKQEERFVKFVNLWSDALEREKEVNVIGDFNINLKENVKMSSLHTRLYDSIQKEIHPKGVLQMVKGVTRQQGSSKSSLLNHIYSTESEKIEIENVP